MIWRNFLSEGFMARHVTSSPHLLRCLLRTCCSRLAACYSPSTSPSLHPQAKWGRPSKAVLKDDTYTFFMNTQGNGQDLDQRNSRPLK